jgi:hypothetical protein
MFGHPKKRLCYREKFPAVRPAANQDLIPFTIDDATRITSCELSPCAIDFANGESEQASVNRDVAKQEREAQPQSERFRFPEDAKQA